MKRKHFIITGILCVLFLIGYLAADSLYFKPNRLQKIKDGLEYELSAKYNKTFVVSDLSFGKALGDKEGIYTANVYPKEDRHLEFQVHLAEDGNIIDESYKEIKWRSEAYQVWKSFMSEMRIASYAVNIHIPEEIANQYDVERSYGDIYSKHKQVMSEYLFIGQIEKSFNKQKETARILKLTNHIMNRGLKDFSIEWSYYKNVSHNADVFDLRKTTPSYSWRFSREAVLKGVNEKNLNRYFIQH